MAKVKIWAHRGASAYVPENTLDAFDRAVQLNADGVELDVQLTKDGKVVVVHDERLERVSNGVGYVKDYTLKELRRFNFNKTHSDYRRTCRIATLKEVYNLLEPTGLTINVELKTGVFPYPGIEEKVLLLTRECGMEDRVIYSSFRHESLVKLKELDPSVKTGILYSDGWYKVEDYAVNVIHACALHPSILHLDDQDYVKRAHAAGLKVNVWTADTTAEFQKCVAQGVDAIITDRPDACRIAMSDMV